MKYIVTGLIIVADFIVQSTVFDYLKIAEVKPNTFIILLVSFSILQGSLSGALIGLFGGLLHDIFFSDAIGINALFYMLLGYSVGYLNQKIYKDSLVIPVVVTFVTSIVFGILTFLYTFFSKYQIEFYNIFITELLPEAIYNSILSIFIYRWIFKLNNYKFMGKKWRYRKS